MNVVYIDRRWQGQVWFFFMIQHGSDPSVGCDYTWPG